ncbi:L-serine ammonia-lyase, iron-sulfur-dependent, subunit beta, partial [Shewanella sp. C31]|nr:L-serine ammonia-lyase, iron-sulfur-dependent, subunit beta [Shewanella electrica]
MVGPSSSHTAGACRLALLARHLLGEKPRRVEFGLHGSFAKTGKGH